MEIVKQTKDYQIIKKRSGRYGVRSANRKWITGDEKVKILVAEGLLKETAPKAADDTSANEATEAEETAETSTGTEPEESTETESGADAESETEKE